MTGYTAGFWCTKKGGKKNNWERRKIFNIALKTIWIVGETDIRCRYIT